MRFKFIQKHIRVARFYNFHERIPDVMDSTADLRYLVLPRRPAGTEGMNEEQLAKLVTRDSMIGVADALSPASIAASA